MLQPTRFRLPLALTLASASLLSACIVVPVGGRHRHGGYYADEGGQGAVVVAAPPPQVEVVGVAPGPGYIWISGFWNPMGGRQVWIGGHWQRR